jgi:hypothetical protein
MEQIGSSSWYYGKAFLAAHVIAAIKELEDAGKVVIDVVCIHDTVFIRALGG